jgi:hypothetical protein
MGRKRATTSAGGAQTPLTGMEDEFEVPAAVQAAADKYSKTYRAKSKAAASFKSAREELIQSMVDDEVSRVRISTPTGEKWCVCDVDHKLHYEPIESQNGEATDDE